MPVLSPPSPKRPSRFSRPRLEVLEDRAVPANLTMSIASISGNTINLTGRLSNAPDVAFETIYLGGSVSATTGTNAQGEFSATVISNLAGTICATAPIYPEAMTAVMFGWEAPVLTSFDAIEGQNSVWTLRGTVTYPRFFESMTIKFGGVPVTIQNKTTTATSDGHFERTIVLNGNDNDNGTVWAKAISPFGVESNMLTDYIHQTGT